MKHINLICLCVSKPPSFCPTMLLFVNLFFLCKYKHVWLKDDRRHSLKLCRTKCVRTVSRLHYQYLGRERLKIRQDCSGFHVSETYKGAEVEM